MAARTKVPVLSFPVVRHTLGNGLRVVLSPDRSAPVAGVAVYYDVGFRSEPEGRTGFAHLFEHLMFQGSVSLEKGEHSKLVQGNGGSFNGSTNTDYTNYFEELPSEALEVGLFLEADRMHGPRITEENLQNQISVVKEEIRVNVLNRPYGGFPWIHLPPVMFRTYNNAHNGYGSFEDLESATVDDAADFFKRYYAPANAVLCVVGDFDADKTLALIEKHFGGVKKRSRPKRPSFAEPVPDTERRAVRHDPMAPSPAVAIGYRVPDPLGDMTEYLAAVLAVDVLADGDASRLFQRVVKKDQLASHLFGYVGLFGNPFEVRDPTMAQVMAYYHGADNPDGLLAAVDAEVEGLVAGGVTDDELERARNSWLSSYFQRCDNFMQRGLTLATLEQQRGRPDLLNELPAALAQVGPDDIRAAAERWLRPDSRAVLDIQPGGEG
jgi:predicted Zn-dependent peptidase